MFKKILLLILVISVGFGFCFANFTNADNNTNYIEIDNPVGENNILGIVNRLINILFIACIYGGIIMIIWAGWTMVTSQGKPEKTKMATQMIVWVLVGIVVVGLAKAIISFTYYIVTGNKTGINWEQQSTEIENKNTNDIPYAPEINVEDDNVNVIPEFNSNLWEDI